MTVTLFVTFLVMALLSLILISMTVYYRNDIPAMTGMLISMSLGMIGGLTIGVILGILFTGNLYYATIVSSLIGITIGFLIGLPIGLFAVLDGTLSGLMGGMMGAMLGIMIAPEYQDSIIRIMFLLFISISILLLQVIKQDFMNKNSNQPFIILCLFGFILFIIIYNQLGPIV